MSRWPLVELDEVASTQAEAQRLAAGGERGPLWVRARRQAGGKGRAGRAWHSPEGNLYTTLLLRPEAALADLYGLAFVTALAAHDAVRHFLSPGAPVRLKWPNDVLVGRAKVAGILIETAVTPGSGEVNTLAMAGIGINVAHAPSLPDRETTCIAAHAPHPIEVSAVMERLDREMQFWIGRWQQGRAFDVVRAAWRERAGPAGEPLTISAGERQIAGTFVDLGADGSLVVLDAQGRTQKIHYGDVALGPAGAIARGSDGAG